MNFFSKNLVFVFFLFIVSEKNKTCHVLMNTSFFSDIGFICSTHFESGLTLGISMFDIKLGFDKKFAKVGVFANFINIYELESCFLSCSLLGKMNSLQDVRIHGLNFDISFRTWEFPINIGCSLVLFKDRPKFSFGLILRFNYCFLTRFNVGGNIGILYIKDRNIESLFVKDPDYFSVSNFNLDSQCLKIIRQNRDIMKNNDEYYKTYKNFLDNQYQIKEQITILNDLSSKHNWDDFDDEFEIFEKKKKDLSNDLKEIYRIIYLSDINLNFFKKNEIKIFRKFYHKLLKTIETEEEKLKKQKDRNNPYNSIDYLNLLVLKTLWKEKYLMEIPSNMLEDEQKEKRADLIA